MTAQLSDQDVDRLIKEPKLLPAGFSAQLKGKPKMGHKERQADITGTPVAGSV